MDIENVRSYFLAKKGTIEDTPFGEDVLVFKVMGKMFGLTSLTNIPLTVNVKCDPELAVELRERYESVLPGYHQNKKHWNTVVLDGTVPWKSVCEMIDHSYDIVVAGLPKRLRSELGATPG